MGRTMGIAEGLGKRPGNGLVNVGDKDEARGLQKSLLEHLKNDLGNDPYVWVFQGRKRRLSHNFALYLGF